MRAVTVGSLLILSMYGVTAHADDAASSSAWAGPYIGAFIGSSFGEDRSVRANARAVDYQLDGEEPPPGQEDPGGYCYNAQSGNIINGLTGPEECLNSNPNAVWIATDGGGGGGGGGGSVIGEPLIASQLMRNSTDSGRFLGGIKVGYNWQRDRLVYGLEADISSVRDKTLRESASAEAALIENEELVGETPGMIAVNAKGKLGVDWFGTVRGRLGYAVNDNLLPFVTAGFAYGKVRNKLSYQIADTDYYTEDTAVTSGSVGGKDTETGWTVGAGVDYRLTKNILANVTYLYVDLGGKKEASYAYLGPSGSRTAFVGSEVDPSFHVLRVGLNWQF